jgi:uncharacterized protein YjiS (DUF1127 family)
MMFLRTISSPAAAKPFAAAALATLLRFAAWCARCHARAGQRRDLGALDERLLKDIGVTPADAAEESAKPWWRA